VILGGRVLIMSELPLYTWDTDPGMTRNSWHNLSTSSRGLYHEGN
jgi:hypothetical protein